MAEEKDISTTVKGGAYQSADGTWHDAHGKKIDPPDLPVTAVTSTKPETAAERKARLKAEAQAKKDAEADAAKADE